MCPVIAAQSLRLHMALPCVGTSPSFTKLATRTGPSSSIRHNQPPNLHDPLAPLLVPDRYTVSGGTMTNRLMKVLAGVALLLLLLLIAALFVDEPLRGYIEGKMNRSLKAYRVHIGALDFHPLGGSVDLHEIRLERVDEPNPPVATIARWSASVHWRALLSGRLVNDQEIERPRFHITRTLARQETGNDTPVKERGWQDAVESFYPFKINQIRITDGEILYLDDAKPDQPLRARRMNLYASNIRNVQSGDQ